jgi:rhamnose transport system permease protein
LRLQLQRAWPALITLGALYVYLAFAAPRFYAADNLRDIAVANVAVLLIATGMTQVIVLGQIDISVGALFAICSVVCGTFTKIGMPTILLPLVALAAGAVLGATNGILVSFVKAPSIVVTLATMVAWREALRWITNGAWIEGLPNTFQWFGLGQRTGEAVITISALLLFGVLWWSSRNLSAVRAIYATGSDAEAARLAGIPTKQIVLWVFVVMGALTGIAAMLNAVRFSDVPANSGVNLELKAIAAVVVGGTPITGGRGHLIGTLIGVMLLGSIGPALIFLGVSPHWEKALQGGIILTAVLLDAIGRSRERRVEFA